MNLSYFAILWRNNLLVEPKDFAIASKTAILLFTRSIKEESVHKEFFKRQKGKNTKIVSRLVQYTKQEAQKTGLPVIISKGQTGGSFGERLANEVEKVFHKGFENVLIIGNDCPQLNTALLLAAQAKVEKNQLVLGPDRGGGVYLIGINKSYFEREHFIALEWETCHLLKSFQKYPFISKEDLCFLETLSDINTIDALEKASHTLSYSHRLKQFLFSLFEGTSKPLKFNLNILISSLSFIPSQERAPPF